MDVFDSIIRQDMLLSNVELIIVDGGSRDNTLKIIKDFLEKHGKLFQDVKIIIHDKNYGLSKARNDGIRVSNGRYILILDDDIVMNKSTLTTLLKILDNSPTNVAAVMPLPVRCPENILERWGRLVRENRVSVAPAITNCVLIKREVFEKIGFYDETLGLPFTMGEEIEYAARAKNKGYRVLVIGFEKVLHIDDKACRNRGGRSNNLVADEVSEEGRRNRCLLNAWRRVLGVAKSIGSQPYRYAYKRYVASLPLLDKVKWYTYATTAIFIVLFMIILLISSIFNELISIIQPLALILFTTCLALYVDVLREYWNPRVFHISLAYTAIAMVWRLLRSVMLVMPDKNKRSA